jgi:hypothetical protein
VPLSAPLPTLLSASSLCLRPENRSPNPLLRCRLPADLSRGLKATEAQLESGVRVVTDAERVLQEEADRAGRMLRRMEMEAKMGPWIK